MSSGLLFCLKSYSLGLWKSNLRWILSQFPCSLWKMIKLYVHYFYLCNLKQRQSVSSSLPRVHRQCLETFVVPVTGNRHYWAALARNRTLYREVLCTWQALHSEELLDPRPQNPVLLSLRNTDMLGCKAKANGTCWNSVARSPAFLVV